MIKLTVEDFEDWFGSDHCNFNDVEELLLEIVNEQYSVSQLLKDIQASK